MPPISRRLRTAVIAFPLVLATAALVWNQGRRHGATHAAAPAPLLLSGDRAREAGDYARALGHYHEALARAHDPEQRRALANAFHTLGLSAHRVSKGHGHLSLAAYAAAAQLYRELHDPGNEALALVDTAESVLLRGERAAADELLERVLSLSEGVADPTFQGNIRCRVANFRRGAGRYTEAKALYEQALELRRSVGATEGIADCMTGLGRIAADQGDLPGAIAWFERSEALLQTIPKVETRAGVLVWHGDALVRQGKLAEAQARYDEGLAVWESVDNGYWIGLLHARQARIALLRGEWDHAERLARESLDQITDSNGPAATYAPLEVLGDIALRRGDARRAESLHRRAYALRRQLGNPLREAEGCDALARDLAGRRPDEAREWARRAQELRRAVH